MRKRECIKLGPGKWTVRLGIGAVILMLILYTVVCYILIDNNKVSEEEVASAVKKSDQEVLIAREENLPTDIPVPGSEYQVDWECGTYYSNISKDAIETYLLTLKNAGWEDFKAEEQSIKVVNGTSTYRFVKDDMILQMIVSLEGEFPLCNSILLRVDDGINVEELNRRKAAVDVVNVREMIQTAIDYKVKEGELPAARQNIEGIFEIYIPNAYDKLELQAFAAISNPGVIGCFLVRKGVVSYVEGNLANAIIADIDQDGSEELVDLYSTWEAGLFKNFLIAYEYLNPISFSSYTEIPVKKYSNCFVPAGDYERLTLLRKDGEIRLLGEYTDYGTLVVKEQSIILQDMEHFPYDEWATTYDQSLLTKNEKKLPAEPPEVIVTIDGIGLDYVVHKTSWNGEESDFTKEMAFDEILAKDEFLPKVFLGSFGTEAPERTIIMDFGDSIPDTIQISDFLLDEKGAQRFGGKLGLEQTAKILDSSRVSFPLAQHMSLYLSSNSRDYDRDWRRLFLITCRFGERECVYAVLLNTGKNEQLTALSEHDFLQCEGTYSRLSSSWGLGLSVQSDRLPERYLIEWQVSGGMIRSWDSATKKPIGITAQHNSYPVTYSQDDNKGELIWNPISFNDSDEVTVRALIYEGEKQRNPLAFDEIILIKRGEAWQCKKKERIK